MRLINIVNYNFKRQFRDRLGLLLTLLTAPFLVALYGILFARGEVTNSKTIILLKSEENVQSEFDWMELLQNQLQKSDLDDNTFSLDLKTVGNKQSFERHLKNQNVLMGIEAVSKKNGISSGNEDPVQFIFHGITSDPLFKATSNAIQFRLLNELIITTGLSLPFNVIEKPSVSRSPKTLFDRYVPGLLVFAVIMLIFSAAMTVTRDVENGTLERLKMTPLNSFEFMAGLSIVQLTLGSGSVVLTFITAHIFGFNAAGSLSIAFLLILIGCLSSLGIGMIVASLSKTLILAFLIASVSMFLMVLFSGIVFPRPQIVLVELAGYPIELLDILPTKHLVVGLEKVLTFGASFFDIIYEISSLFILSMVFFAAGVVIFRKTSFSFFTQ